MPVRVLRGRPTPRDRLGGLTGIVTLEARTLSPIHVGAGPQAAGGREVDREALGRLKEALLRGGEQAVGMLEGEAERVLTGESPEAPVYRLRGKPAVPGTTLKGVVRSRIELSLKVVDGEIPSCFSVGEDSGAGFGSSIHRGIYPSSLQDRGVRCDLTRRDEVCRVCDVFGAPGLASRVGFGPIVFDVETRVLRLPRGGVEVIPEGAESEGVVYFSGLSSEELGLLMYGLGAVPGMGPIPVGGWRFHRLAGSPMGKLQLAVRRWRFHPTSRGVDREVSGEAASEMARELWEAAKEGERFGKWLEEVREYERLEEMWKAGG